MKIKAVVEKDEFDVPSSITELERILHEYGLEIVPKNLIEDDVFYFYFRNPYIRYPHMHSLIEMIRYRDDFPCVKCNHELVGISKKYLNTPYVLLKDFPVIYTCPGIDPIPVILYTHKRSDYLKLSLNALIYSFGKELFDLTIFLSDPSVGVEEIVDDALRDNPFITVLRSEKNIACGAINAYLQIKRPEKFVIFEEDYILPSHTRFVLPCWARRFNYLLDKFDVVNFQTSLDNQSVGFFDALNKSKRYSPFSFSHEWLTDKNSDIHMTGNGLATKTKYYASLGNNPPFYISGDGRVFSKAHSICASSIHGYHVGWNQEMDGFENLTDWDRFPSPDPVQIVANIKTGDEYTIDLRDIIKL